MQTDQQMIMARVRQVVGEVHTVDLDVVDDGDVTGWAAQFGVSVDKLTDVVSGNGHPIYRLSGTLDALTALVAVYVD